MKQTKSFREEMSRLSSIAISSHTIWMEICEEELKVCTPLKSLHTLASKSLHGKYHYLNMGYCGKYTMKTNALIKKKRLQKQCMAFVLTACYLLNLTLFTEWFSYEAF